MANDDWKSWFSSAEVQVLEVLTSDHLPFCVCLNKHVYIPRERRFCFENSWIKKNECRSTIQNCWNIEGMDDILEKMVRYCAKLEEWGEAY